MGLFNIKEVQEQAEKEVKEEQMKDAKEKIKSQLKRVELAEKALANEKRVLEDLYIQLSK